MLRPLPLSARPRCTAASVLPSTTRTWGARCALYDIIDNMQLKDEAVKDKYGKGEGATKPGSMLHKAFMAEIGEEMCQAEVAHHANRIPEFFVSRQV